MPDNAPLKVGDAAPDFELMTQDPARKVKLSDLRGKRVVLLFYPMDFSTVCTAEHCSFGPQFADLSAASSTVVFGVSCDHPFAHAAFKKQYNIPYDLLSDVTRSMSKSYGMFMGEEPFNCSKRGTVIVGPDGKVAFYHEQPILEERSVDQLKKLVAGH